MQHDPLCCDYSWTLTPQGWSVRLSQDGIEVAWWPSSPSFSPDSSGGWLVCSLLWDACPFLSSVWGWFWLFSTVGELSFSPGLIKDIKKCLLFSAAKVVYHISHWWHHHFQEASWFFSFLTSSWSSWMVRSEVISLLGFRHFWEYLIWLRTFAALPLGIFSELSSWKLSASKLAAPPPSCGQSVVFF